MISRETYQYELVKKLSFVRYGGTDGEKRASEIIADEITRSGGSPEIMEFQIPACDIHSCSVRVTAPFERELEAVPFGCSGELPEGGSDLRLIYIETSSDVDFSRVGDLSDTAVLINSLNWEMYKKLYDRHAAAFILIAQDRWWNTPEDTDLIPRLLRDEYKEIGLIPGFSIRSSTATEIIREGACAVHLDLRETMTTHTSRDVLAVIPGTEIRDQSVVLTGHMDSILYGTGSWDNATGAATLMFLYRHFLANPPRRTLRFIWCGSEEQGLYGSLAYVEQHPELLDEIRFCFNFDMCGTVLGQNQIMITGGDDLKNYVEQICFEAGFDHVVRVGVHSSDSAPFAAKGIPAVGISRGHMQSCEIHSRHDLIFPISAPALLMTAEFSVLIISRFVNSVILPIKRDLPENIRREVDNYFWVDKLAELRKEK